MPETYSPIQWINNTFPAINESNLNRIEQGVEALDDRAAQIELGITTPVTLTYATSITLNATQGSLFRCTATGDLTLDDIVGGTNGQLITFEVLASGAQRALHFTGTTGSIDLPAGQRWIGAFRYDQGGDTWTLINNSGGGTSGSSNDLNILAPQNVAYAATVTLNAATGALFRITAIGDLTLANPINGTDGQGVVVEIEASGGTRAVSFAGGAVAPVAIPSGSRWTGTLRYNAGAGVWVLAAGSSGSSSGGSVTSVNGMAGVVVLAADNIADGTSRVIMTTAERSKLTGIATAATANATDAQLRNRGTHTGTQPVSSLTATGTPSSATYLRGDGVWATPAGGGGSSTGVLFAANNTGGANVSAALVTQATTASANGVPLIVPPGTYLFTATAALPANLTMWAPSGARFFGVVPDAALITVASNTTITGITFENTSEPNGNSASIQTAAKNIIFDDCTLIAPSIGIHANTAGIENLTVRDCRIQNTYFGVLTNTGANDIKGVRVEGCHFSGILGDAIEFNHPSDTAPTCSGFRVQGCYIEGVTGGTGDSTGFGIGVAGCSDVALVGNTIVGVRREGIHVEDGSRDVAISGNTVRNIPASATARGGICIYGVGTANVAVTANTLDSINGIGIELVYSGGTDLVSNVTIADNIVRGCTAAGISAGANGTAGGLWSVTDNVIISVGTYGITFNGTFDQGSIQGNVISGCATGIGCGEFGKVRLVRNNLITDWTAADIDGYGQGIQLTSRDARVSATATTTTMTVPLMRLGLRAEGQVSIALYDGSTRFVDSMWRVRWTGSALSCARIGSDNAVSDDTNLSVVNGVLSVSLTGVANAVVMAGNATFAGLINETSVTLTGTVVGAAFSDSGGGGSTTINAQTGTTYTFALGDAGPAVVRAGNAGAQTYTIPPNSSVAFPVGTTLEVMRYGAGTLTLAAGVGVTLRTPATLTARAQYSTVSAIKLATNEWLIGGDLT